MTLKSYKKQLSAKYCLVVKKSFFAALYRSPNQSNEDFEELYRKIQDTHDQIEDLKLHCTILTGDFNCRTKLNNCGRVILIHPKELRLMN